MLSVFKAKASVVLRVRLQVAADTATECVLLSVERMLDLERALVRTRAFRQFISGLARHVVAAALLLVAWLTEVRVSPAEPLGDVAAEFALKLNKVRSMLRAALDATANSDGCALTTNELFFLEVLVVDVSRIAVLHTSEVRVSALEAHVVRELFQGISL